MAPTPESLRARPHEPTFAASKLIPSWARAALSTGDVGVASSAIPADGAGAEQQVTAVPLPLAKGESSDAFWDSAYLFGVSFVHTNGRMLMPSPPLNPPQPARSTSSRRASSTTICA